MFFLRCAFWLAVVYSSMSWTAGQFADPRRAAEPVAPQSARLLQTAIGAAVDYCAHRATDCLSDAARLTALAQQAEQVGPERAIAPTSSRQASASPLPLPVPDPRRR